jgi:lipopolysaccharide/colanic/teichoic acid biosynthesis glycosyltransferase
VPPWRLFSERGIEEAPREASYTLPPLPARRRKKTQSLGLSFLPTKYFRRDALVGSVAHVFSLRSTRSPRSPQLIAKRSFDVSASAAMLVILSPLFLVASLAVTLDSRGPIFSVSRKYCYKDQTIHVLNFRCRETFVGSSLTRSGLDRLPMLINVLRGDMSIARWIFQNTSPAL